MRNLLLEIGFGQAWAHAASYFSYWLWLILSLAVAGASYYFISKNVRHKGWSTIQIIAIGVALALVLAALLIPPATIAANTTPEQAARGVYIR
jgi:phosphoglycerol transferase MdoB-like AlkP superfamily enzyme